MSLSHVNQLQKELEQSKWVIHTDTSTIEIKEEWNISRPNGDSKLSLKFEFSGNGGFGAEIGNEDMGNAIGCQVEGQHKLDMYFGKFTGKFQQDISAFMEVLNEIQIDKQA
jgi:hypothetical protein